MADYGDMFYGTLPEDTQDFRHVLAGIGRTIRDRAAAAGQRIGQSGQEAIALQNQIFGDPNRPLRVTDKNALRRYTDMIMGGPLGFAPAGITAYHGSPYLFRMFNPAKVGTGEGAQAYGVGSGYTAEARPVAETYKNPGGPRTGTTPITIDNIEATQWKQNPNLSKVEQRAADAISRTRNPDYAIDYLKQDIEFDKTAADAIKWIEKNKNRFGNPGFLYKGDIPDEILPKFLDWDKKFSEQSPEVKEAITKYWNENKVYGDPKKLSGAGLYDSIVAHVFGDAGRAGAQQAASAELEKIGLRGIRYLDQGSRGQGKGTSNFIPFRPEDYKIQEINDIPLEEWIRRGLLD